MFLHIDLRVRANSACNFYSSSSVEADHPPKALFRFAKNAWADKFCGAKLCPSPKSLHVTYFVYIKSFYSLLKSISPFCF